jgi:hypothetical protein
VPASLPPSFILSSAILYSIILEREFVFGCGWLCLGRCGLVLPTMIGIAAITQHHHLIGYNLDTGVFLAFLIVPTPGLEASLYVNLLPFGKVLFTNLGQITPGYNVEPLSLRMPLSISAVPRPADCHRVSGYGTARRCITHFGVFSQMTDNHYFIQASAHVTLLFTASLINV